METNLIYEREYESIHGGKYLAPGIHELVKDTVATSIAQGYGQCSLFKIPVETKFTRDKCFMSEYGGMNSDGDGMVSLVAGKAGERMHPYTTSLKSDKTSFRVSIGNKFAFGVRTANTNQNGIIICQIEKIVDIPKDCGARAFKHAICSVIGVWFRDGEFELKCIEEKIYDLAHTALRKLTTLKPTKLMFYRSTNLIGDKSVIYKDCLNVLKHQARYNFRDYERVDPKYLLDKIDETIEGNYKNTAPLVPIVVAVKGDKRSYDRLQLKVLILNKPKIKNNKNINKLYTRFAYTTTLTEKNFWPFKKLLLPREPSFQALVAKCHSKPNLLKSLVLSYRNS